MHAATTGLPVLLLLLCWFLETNYLGHLRVAREYSCILLGMLVLLAGFCVAAVRNEQRQGREASFGMTLGSFISAPSLSLLCIATFSCCILSHTEVIKRTGTRL